MDSQLKMTYQWQGMCLTTMNIFAFIVSEISRLKLPYRCENGDEIPVEVNRFIQSKENGVICSEGEKTL